MKDIEPGQQTYLNTLIERYPVLKSCEKDLTEAYCLLKDSYKAGGKLLVAGNGGSAADAEHITGELMKSFKKKRPLSDNMKKKLQSADKVMGAHLSDVLEQPLPAIALVGHEAGIAVVSLTGASGGKLAALADAAVHVPETETFKVQKLHLPVYHCLCLMLEDYFFRE